MPRQDLNDSAAPSPIDGATSPDLSSKKRKVSASSRGVASLTPEQLAKKRANDREAQRAIRERTKTQIETLERKIQELTSQQPYQELQAVLRQKDAIQAENDEIRRRLASILSIIQPIVGAQSLTDLATAAQGNAHSDQPPPTYDRHHYLNGRNGHASAPTFSGESPISVPTVTPPSASAYQQPYPNSNNTVPSEGQWSTTVDAFDHQRNTLQRGLELNQSGERLGFNFLLDGTQQVNKLKHPQQSGSQHDSPSSHEMYPQITGSQYPDQQIPSWAAPCRNISPTCPLDTILLDFLHARQREGADGVPGNRLVGPSYPSVSSLLNPEKGRYSHPLSQVFTDILSKFPDISGLPEQVAVLYIMFLVMRWSIYPTQDNYERLPEWMTPRPSQLFTPHPAWIDYLPWPKMRDKLVSCYQDYPFENWFIPYTTTLSLNWQYEPTDCLLSSPESDELMINPVFERHLMRLENWSLGPAFAKAHPSIAMTARIRRGERRNSVGLGRDGFVQRK